MFKRLALFFTNLPIHGVVKFFRVGATIIWTKARLGPATALEVIGRGLLAHLWVNGRGLLAPLGVNGRGLLAALRGNERGLLVSLWVNGRGMLAAVPLLAAAPPDG